MINCDPVDKKGPSKKADAKALAGDKKSPPGTNNKEKKSPEKNNNKSLMKGKYTAKDDKKNTPGELFVFRILSFCICFVDCIIITYPIISEY